MLALGIGYALVAYVGELRGTGGRDRAYKNARRRIGRAILLGLELLVAGEIIRTIVVSPTFTSVGVLAVIVAVRTFLSFTPETEITGRLPWHRAHADE